MPIAAAVSIIGRLRLSEPWRFKAPALVALVYLYLYAADVPAAAAVMHVAASLCTVVGIAGSGYLINDLWDREADRRAGRPNGLLGMPATSIVACLVVLLAAALGPWIVFFTSDRLSRALLAAEFLLFLAYAVPPVRLKDRSMLGVWADALYAHAIPALLAAYTFHLMTSRAFGAGLAFAVLSGTWQLFVGMRHIVQHQTLDAAADRLAGAETYVRRRGERSAARLLRRVVLPAEVSAEIAWLIVAGRILPAIPVAFVVHFAITAAIIHWHWRQALFRSLENRPRLFLDRFSLEWLPLVILGALALRDPRMIVLLAVHGLCFKTGLSAVAVWARDRLRALSRRRAAARAAGPSEASPPARRRSPDTGRATR